MTLNNIIIDTHTHTKASDGTFTPQESVVYAKKQGLEVIAKTDHDTTWGMDEALVAAQKYGIKVIPGIEIDAIYYHPQSDKKVKGLELLGLNIDVGLLSDFEKRLQTIRRSVVNFAVNAFNEYILQPEFAEENILKNFQLINPQPIDVQTLVREHNQLLDYKNPNPFLSKGSVIKYIAENFILKSQEQENLIKRNLLEENTFKEEYMFMFASYVRKATFQEAIRAVHDANGKAVIAHPGRYLGYNHGMLKEWELPKENWFVETDDLTPYTFLSDLVQDGLDGIELYNYAGCDKKHGPAQKRINEYFQALANKLDVFTTYGSDCHGLRNKGPQLGKFGGTQDYSHLL